MTVKLNKDGRFLSRVWNPPTEWNEETGRYEDEGYHRYFALNNAESIILSWKEQIILEDGVTLRHLMMALNSIPNIEEIGPLVVNGHIREFIEEAFTPAEADTQIIEFVWYWHAEFGKTWADDENFDDDRADCRTIENGFTCHGNISGRAAVPHEMGVNYSIDNCPQNIYMHVPLRLDETFSVWDSNDYKATDPILKAKKIWTLGEFLYTYLWELSWHGSPKGRDEFNAKMEEQFRGIDEGRAKLYSLEDLDRAMMGDEFVDNLIEKGEYDGGLPSK